MTQINVTDPGLVLLVGSTGSGKSTLARRIFAADEIVSLDACRAMVCGNPHDQSATDDAAQVAEMIVSARLKRRLLTVVDATNVRLADRNRWTALARQHHTLVAAVVLDPGISQCIENAKARGEGRFNPKTINLHHELLGRSIKKLNRADGIAYSVILKTVDEIATATLERRKIFNDMRDDHGPFDIIGDVHGMTDELERLLAELGWSVVWSGEGSGRTADLSHPENRKLVFVGDLVDRGPRSLDALRIVRAAVSSGRGYAVAGNHDVRVSKWLRGRADPEGFGIETTKADFAGTDASFQAEMGEFLDALPSHYVFDSGKLAVSHAGLEEGMILGASKEVREFAVYGPKTPQDADGNSERIDWALDYKGRCSQVYGHTPFEKAEWFNNTICVDTGCVFGGKLTAVRWPERDVVSVDASRSYVDFEKAFLTRDSERGFLDLSRSDITGKKRITTSLAHTVTVDAEHMAAATELLARFTIDPRWLVYLPPTMSPVESSPRPDFLEHPDEAFKYYRDAGLSTVVTETKHMGSRAHILVCRDAKTANLRFHTNDDHIGHVWSRNGNPFFKTPDRRVVLERVAAAAAPLFDSLKSDWLLLDAEIMPWSAKAGGLIASQYAPTGVAAKVGNGLVLDALDRFAARNVEDVSDLRQEFARQLKNAEAFDITWRGYTWETPSLDGIRIAPFHVLASEGRVHKFETHATHMKWVSLMLGTDPMLMGTEFHEVDLSDPASLDAAVERWLAATAARAEGMVVKPPLFATTGDKGLIQPALKVRGRDYLRIIYGVDYDMPQNLERLKERATRAKRARAIREFACGVEALDRLIKREPLRRVHECVAAILGLEADLTDPRL